MSQDDFFSAGEYNILMLDYREGGRHLHSSILEPPSQPVDIRNALLAGFAEVFLLEMKQYKSSQEYTNNINTLTLLCDPEKLERYREEPTLFDQWEIFFTKAPSALQTNIRLEVEESLLEELVGSVGNVDITGQPQKVALESENLRLRLKATDNYPEIVRDMVGNRFETAIAGGIAEGIRRILEILDGSLGDPSLPILRYGMSSEVASVVGNPLQTNLPGVLVQYGYTQGIPFPTERTLIINPL